MSTYDSKAELPMAHHLLGLKSEVVEAWESGVTERINKVRTLIKALDKVAGELRKDFDDNFDDKAVMGSDFAKNVERIRIKSDKVGRPAQPKPQAIDAF